jgi:hypothetical protein
MVERAATHTFTLKTELLSPFKIKLMLPWFQRGDYLDARFVD